MAIMYIGMAFARKGLYYIHILMLHYPGTITMKNWQRLSFMTIFISQICRLKLDITQYTFNICEHPISFICMYKMVHDPFRFD